MLRRYRDWNGMMFDSLETLAGNLVIPVVYRVVSKLMKRYHAKANTDGTLIGDRNALKQRLTRKAKFRVSRQQSVIDSEVRKICREIETKERKSLDSLGRAAIENYVNTLSNIATNRAAQSYVGSSISSPEAKEILIRLRESYP